jgi:hypothetical protein
MIFHLTGARTAKASRHYRTGDYPTTTTTETGGDSAQHRMCRQQTQVAHV